MAAGASFASEALGVFSIARWFLPRVGSERAGEARFPPVSLLSAGTTTCFVYVLHCLYWWSSSDVVELLKVRCAGRGQLETPGKDEADVWWENMEDGRRHGVLQSTSSFTAPQILSRMPHYAAHSPPFSLLPLFPPLSPPFVFDQQCLFTNLILKRSSRSVSGCYTP